MLEITDIDHDAIDVTNSTLAVPTTIDRDILWLVGMVAHKSTAFDGGPCWVLGLERLSIRPHESGKQAFERQTGEKLAKNQIVYVLDR